MWLLTAMGGTSLARTSALTASAKSPMKALDSTAKSLRAPQLPPASHAFADDVVVVAPRPSIVSLESLGMEAGVVSDPNTLP
jgi:hypothetical protein